MTSGIPNYSETETISRAWVNEPIRDLTAKELVQAAYPGDANALPTYPGYHYSNTNYVLAGMIAEKAAGRSYRDLVHEMVIDATGLTSTFYENGTYPAPVINRLAHGYFDNPACADYQPNCKESWTLPLIGRGRARHEHLLDAGGGRRRGERARRRSVDARGIRGPRGSADAAGGVDVAGLYQDRQSDR
jgi:D-alanyl-D-alanine carboxypeptidase